jgi:hypothetical protein
MEGLIKDASLFHDVLAIHLPELSAHLDLYKLDVLMYMTPWFLSLYTHLPNWELVLAIYDMVFVEGYALTHACLLAYLLVTLGLLCLRLRAGGLQDIGTVPLRVGHSGGLRRGAVEPPRDRTPPPLPPERAHRSTPH